MKEELETTLKFVFMKHIDRPELDDDIHVDNFGHEYTCTHNKNHMKIYMHMHLDNAFRKQHLKMLDKMKPIIVLENKFIHKHFYDLVVSYSYMSGDVQKKIIYMSKCNLIKFDSCVIHLAQPMIELQPYTMSYPAKYQCTPNNMVYGYEGEPMENWYE